MKNQKTFATIAIMLVVVIIIGYIIYDNITGEGEESGTQYSLDETYDKVRNGARLIISYDTQSNSFIGTVENTVDYILKNVRVEIHLSNGQELGPTTPADLEPGEKMNINLMATSTNFVWWTAHPEVG